MFENYSGNFRTLQEQACYNQMDDGKTWLPDLGGGGGYEGSSQTFVWQFLDGKYESIFE